MAEVVGRAGELDIAIVGFAGRFPGADSVEQLWANLLDNVESISFFSVDELLARGVPSELLANPSYVRAGAVLEHADKFDAGFFGFSPREAEIVDPQQRIFLECAWEALESAGYSSERSTLSVGVFAGATMNTYLLANLMGHRDVLEVVGDLQTMIGNDKDFLATRVSYELDLRGPSFTVQTACSSSLVAVHTARMNLLAGECDLAIAGGSSVRVPQGLGYLHQKAGTSSPDGHCRAFDVDAEGSVVGSGVGAVVLRRLEDAIAAGDTIHAVIKSSAINNDGGDKVGFTAPSSEGQARVVADALELAGIDPESIRYIEPHGTGTALGDPIEIAGLTRAFRRFTKASSFCAIGSLKTNIGHLDAAAGIASLLKAIHIVKHRQIPASLNFTTPNLQLRLGDGPFFVAGERMPYPPDTRWPPRAGVSSFGIGGTNAHVIVEAPPAAVPPAPNVRDVEILTLSAKTTQALEAASDRWAERLATLPAESFPDAVFTAHVGRRHFAHCRAVLARTPAEAAAALSARLGVLDGDTTAGTPTVVFLFPGQGTQLIGAASSLYRDVPRFRRELDRSANALIAMSGYDLRSLLYPQLAERTEAERLLETTALAQPVTVALEWALAQLFMAYGVTPAALVGHSVGEIAAAAVAGVFSLEDALEIAIRRGALMQAIDEGAMVAVNAPATVVEGFLQGGTSIAAYNAPESQVVSGSVPSILGLEREFEAAGIPYQRLRTARAFHSSMIDPVLAPLAEVLRSVRRSAPRISIISNVTGQPLSAEQASDPDYWAQHARAPVRFGDAIAVMGEDDAVVFLEVGPGGVLSLLAEMTLRQRSPGHEHRAIRGMRATRDERSDDEVLQEALALLYVRGVPVAWQAYHSDEKRRRIPMPTYPFARESYWIEPAPSDRQLQTRPAEQFEPLSVTSWEAGSPSSRD